MNTEIPDHPGLSTNDPPARDWVWGAFAGLKKEYRFIKRIKGTALIMFRLFDPSRKSPYGDIMNVRFGFEFPLQHRPAKTKGGS